jgi:hypothetical protein
VRLNNRTAAMNKRFIDEPDLKKDAKTHPGCLCSMGVVGVFDNCRGLFKGVAFLNFTNERVIHE